jgi:3-oxoadipate enol-lactonase
MVDVGGATVGGVRLAYAVYGQPDRPPMVLLHAFGQDRGSWAQVGPALAGAHQVFAVDLRGHGASDRPGVYSLELMCADVAGLLAALRLDPVVLVGHSLGGSVSFVLAEEHPQLLAALVTEDTPPPRPGTRVRARRRSGPVPYDPRVAAAVFAQLNHPDPAWWDRLDQISAPTLVIAGGPDSHVPQDQLAEVAALIPHCRPLVTIPVGHHVHEQRPVQFVAAVSTFLADLASPARP